MVHSCRSALPCNKKSRPDVERLLAFAPRLCLALRPLPSLGSHIHTTDGAQVWTTLVLSADTAGTPIVQCRTPPVPISGSYRLQLFYFGIDCVNPLISFYYHDVLHVESIEPAEIPNIDHPPRDVLGTPLGKSSVTLLLRNSECGVIQAGCGGASACVKLVSSNDKTEVVLPLQLADERSDVDELYWTFKVAWRQTQTLKDVFIDRMKCR